MHCVRLTPLEAELLAHIPADGTRINSKDLADLYYPEGCPEHARTIVVGRAKGVARKLKRMNDARVLHKSRRRGPQPAEFWLTVKS